MKKRMMILAVAGVFAGSNAAFAAEKMSASVNGFVDNIYSAMSDLGDGFLSPDGGATLIPLGTDVDGEQANAFERKFITTAEVDFAASMGAVSTRVDINADVFGAGSGNVDVEQAYGGWQINDAVALMVGTFNNPMGFEAEDAPDMYQTSHSLVWHVLDNQTNLAGNNVQGAAVKGDIGGVTLTGALLNEVGGNVDETESFMGMVAGSPMEGLDLELSFLTQEDNDPTFNPGSAEGIADFNAAYNFKAGEMPSKVWLDFLSAGAIVDTAYSVGGMIGVGGNVSITLRYDAVEYNEDDVTLDDSDMTTLAVAWAPVANVTLLGEFTTGSLDNNNIIYDDNGDLMEDADAFTLEALYTF